MDILILNPQKVGSSVCVCVYKLTSDSDVLRGGRPVVCAILGLRDSYAQWGFRDWN